MASVAIRRTPWRMVTLSEFAVACQQTGRPRAALGSVTREDVLRACKRRGILVKDGRFYSSYVPNVALELCRQVCATTQTPDGP